MSSRVLSGPQWLKESETQVVTEMGFYQCSRTKYYISTRFVYRQEVTLYLLYRRFTVRTFWRKPLSSGQHSSIHLSNSKNGSHESDPQLSLRRVWFLRVRLFECHLSVSGDESPETMCLSSRFRCLPSKFKTTPFSLVQMNLFECYR